jgi:hypothetical protein
VRYDTATPYYLIAMAYLYSDVFFEYAAGECDIHSTERATCCAKSLPCHATAPVPTIMTSTLTIA